MVPVFFAAGFVMTRCQQRYLARYRRLRGLDPLQSARIGAAPWLFFGLFPRMMRDVFAAYDTVQTEAELERLRRDVQKWKRITMSAFALLMLLAIVRLAGIA